ncbi:hypothetical protein B0H11DRAFT_2061192 [Mycena galericulata]|nr:hypothetical protein B0H11DRAFT_2061192 [Mycena galericulata]
MSEHSINSVLGLDLILEILDCLAIPLASHQRACDLSVLAACSSVCKPWSSHAQKLLFRRVIIPNNIYREPHRRGTTRNTLPSFLAAIDPGTERGRHLASSVLCLTLRHTGRDPTADPTGLATALLRTPNLRHLDVTTILCNFDPETLVQLRESGPRITSLCILQDFSALQEEDTRRMHQLVAAFPSIRLLEISSSFGMELAPFDPPLALSLVSVKFDTPFVQDIAPCLASLLRPPSEDQEHESEPLQLLSHKSHIGYPSALSTVLQAHGSHLRSLTIRTLDVASATDHSSVPALRHCTRLERFELGVFPEASTLAFLPRTLHTLSISGLPNHDNAPPVGPFIYALSTFPHLRTLTWLFCPAPPALVRLCASRGVELRASLFEMADDNAVEMELINKYVRI